MARGRKNYTLEEKLEKITNDITAYKASIKELEEQKKQIEKEIKAQKIEQISELIEASGKSIDEVKELLTK
jgi:hypothetical protein